MFPDRLREGYKAFLGDRFPREQFRFEELAAAGQQPETMIIGCCDSRVSPEVIFDARPGELFVVRNVANMVPPFETQGVFHGTSAALEFAVQALKVKHIVVLGHGRCGGVRAFASEGEPLSPGDFIGKWMTLIAPAAEKAGPRDGQPLGDFVEKLAMISVAQSLENLMTFPCIRILVEKGRLELHGAYFDVTTGVLSLRDPHTGLFTPAEPEVRARVSMFRADGP
ncbi:carbonic anhydrase [Alsobacter sp. SYSU M60028]|uniref:Carbonic anhydrase n=1 Tax=Alsobacter ponti TaxID=2962936 RepID=A0ABT1LB27_9HYPH|nr:carbonic anhydrase [Alsobacter ponti]MCP8938677.1 carbonic anhydrase [Alsobacter ponti]